MTRHEIERIRDQIRRLNRQLGRGTGFPEEVERLESAIADRRTVSATVQFRLDAARRRVQELDDEMRALGAEITGFERGLGAILDQLLEEAGERAEPMWSPIPVLGYRTWHVTAGGLRGATGFVWFGPVLDARCGGAAGVDDGQVPHADGRCGYPPCGIYALKDPAPLLRSQEWRRSEGTVGIVVGLTALSGKVIEHEGGYRGQHARVTAAALLKNSEVLISDDADWIADLFRNPMGVARGNEQCREFRRIPTEPPAIPEVLDFFAHAIQKEQMRWTSGNRSE
jgi:hypothetical protein